MMELEFLKKELKELRNLIKKENKEKEPEIKKNPVNVSEKSSNIINNKIQDVKPEPKSEVRTSPTELSSVKTFSPKVSKVLKRRIR